MQSLPPPPVPPRPPRRVFGKPLQQDRIVGTIRCPGCSGDLPYRLSDVGGCLNCPGCGRAGILVGASLLEDPEEPAQQRPADYRVFLPPPVRATGLRRRLCSLWGLVALGLVASLLFTAQRAIILHPGWLNFESVSTRAGLLGADADGGTEADDAASEPPAITFEAIEALLDRQDLRKALVQAQVWQQVLRDFGVPETDPRSIRLAEIIRQWSEQFRPRLAPPPACLAQFRELLDRLLDALLAKEWNVIRELMAQADALYEAHTSELAVYSRSYLVLRDRFRQMELLREGRERIGEHLSEAERQLRQHKPLEAAEAIAEAMCTALRTPLDEDEFEARNRQVEQLQRELRLTRGKRAVEEAEKLHALGDRRSRDLQLQVALDVLPDLPGEQVESLLHRAQELAAKPIAQPQESGLGQEIAYRTAYEQALSCYGRRGTLLELADACVRADRLLRKIPALGAEARQKVARLILETLDTETGDLLALPSHSPEVAPGLALVRSALDKAVLWKDTARWRAVHEALNAKGDDVAIRVIAEAERQAQAEDLPAAVRTIEPALVLGSPHSQNLARERQQLWDREIRRRQALEAYDEARHEIGELCNHQRFLDAWERFQDFRRRFPDSAQPWDEDALVPKVQQTVEQLLLQMNADYRSGRWGQYRKAAERLPSLPLTPEQQQRLPEIRNILAEFEARAKQRFDQLQEYVQMKTDRDVVSLLETLPQVLELHPEHLEAERMLRHARTRGRQLAEELLLQASRVEGSAPASYREHLQQALKLDPDGPSGREAQKLLDAFDSKAAGS
jgi:hypothetical protein